MKSIFTLLILTSLVTFQITASPPLVLTGKISSAQKQTVTAPRTDNWQIQVQWMEDEGKIVEVGDTITVFDGASVQSLLEQNKDRLEDEKQKYAQKKLDLTLTLEADRNALVVAELEVKKAAVEASIPADKISEYDKGQYQLELERALLEKIKAEQKYLLIQRENKAELEKQEIQILKIEEEIKYQQEQLSRLNVVATVKGPVTHAMHPWNGKKVSTGTNVQVSWKVLEIQAISDFQVESWVHEIDIDELSEKQSVTLSLDAYPHKKYTGYIENLSKQTELNNQWSNSAYYPVKIKFHQLPDEPLLPGMSVRITTESLAKN
jgi:multidrug resistance efflux pump